MMRALPHRSLLLEEDFACRLTAGARQGDPCGARSRAALTGATTGGKGSRISRRRFAMALIPICSLMLAINCVPSLAADWNSLSYVNAKALPKTDPLSEIWADKISAAALYAKENFKQSLPTPDRNAPLDIIAFKFDAGDKSYIASIASTRGCDSGANNFGSDIEREICTLRVARIRAGKIVNVTEATACYVDQRESDIPVQNRSDSTSILVDSATHTLRLRTSVGGKFVPECSVSIPLQ
jgi:hypothetical protein